MRGGGQSADASTYARAKRQDLQAHQEELLHCAPNRLVPAEVQQAARQWIQEDRLGALRGSRRRALHLPEDVDVYAAARGGGLLPLMECIFAFAYVVYGERVCL